MRNLQVPAADRLRPLPTAAMTTGGLGNGASGVSGTNAARTGIEMMPAGATSEKYNRRDLRMKASRITVALMAITLATAAKDNFGAFSLFPGPDLDDRKEIYKDYLASGMPDVGFAALSSSL